jgi:hypothetical protein
MTEGDYADRLEELRNNALGGALRQLLATKVVVFVGYSLSDWNFVRLYEALRADMGKFAPAAYVVSPFDVANNQFDLRHIRTSGVGFLRELKSQLIGHCFLADEVYETVERVEALAWEANDYAGAKSHKTYPAILHCWGYIEGLLDACGRIRMRRTSGEYSDRHHILELVQSYEKLYERAIDEERFFDAAYVDGYVNGLFLLLGDKEHDLEESVPYYYIYGSDLPMRSEADLDAALEKSRRCAPRPRAQARKIVANLPEGMVYKHGPFLSGLEER